MGYRRFSREGPAGEVHVDEGHLLGGLQFGAARHGARPGGGELLRSAQHDLSVRRLYLRDEHRRRYRGIQDQALLRARRLRHPHQPDDHRGPGAWGTDRSVRDRDGPGDPLRRRRQCGDRFVHGFLHAHRGRDAALGDRLHRDAVAASPDRCQGCRREPECRRRAGVFQRRQRRLLVLGCHPYPDAARLLAQLAGGEESGSVRVTMRDREEIAERLAASGYIADAELATAISLMQLLRRPLLLEGEAGVGKTEVAKALAAAHATELIRLQCYEGLDQSAALYEWNYQRQLLSIQAHRGENADAIEDQIFSEKYLLERPLLAAIRRDKPPVLLIDEIDRADDEFEAFLLELLSDFQVSIPELGTIKATSIPRVVLTSNGTRELSDALRRRCLYHYVDFPDVDREARIIVTKSPGIDAAVALQIARMIAAIRKEDLRKVPGVAETLDWAATLAGLDARDLREAPETVHETMMCLLKTHEDRARLTRVVSERLLGKVA